MEYRTEIVALNLREPAPFSNCVLENYNEYLTANHISLKRTSKTVHGDVPLDKIIGIDQMYGGISWGEFLKGNGLKRIRSNLDLLERSPEYYLSSKPKQLSFIRIDDKYFISEGKHRSIIARFFAHFNPSVMGVPPVIKTVTITEYIPDLEFMRIDQAVKDLEKRYPYLYFSLRYTDKEKDACLLITHRERFNVESFRCTRSNTWKAIKAFSNPTIWAKLKNQKPYHLIRFSDVFSRIKYYDADW